MLNEQPMRRFVPHEEAIYNQLLARPEDFVFSADLARIGLLGSGASTAEQLEALGIPHQYVSRGRRGSFLIKKTDALNALGTSEYVRGALVFPGVPGVHLREMLENNQMPVRQKGPALFTFRDDVLRYVAKQAKAAPIPRAPVQAAMPLPPPAASPLELTPVLDLLEEHRESLDRLSGAQAILFKEVQVIRKGLDLILKDLVGPSAATG